MLVAAEFSGIAMITVITSFEGIFCGFSAICAALALLTNERYGRELAPL
ncbi:hypothetical protein IPdc08_01200 [archaeon]|nr:hypothetical protein IPdc08_01200 [archaeon]